MKRIQKTFATLLACAAVVFIGGMAKPVLAANDEVVLYNNFTRREGRFHKPTEKLSHYEYNTKFEEHELEVDVQSVVEDDNPMKNSCHVSFAINPRFIYKIDPQFKTFDPEFEISLNNIINDIKNIIFEFIKCNNYNKFSIWYRIVPLDQYMIKKFPEQYKIILDYTQSFFIDHMSRCIEKCECFSKIYSCKFSDFIKNYDGMYAHYLLEKVII